MCFNLDILLSASLAIQVTREETKTKIETEKRANKHSTRKKKQASNTTQRLRDHLLAISIPNKTFQRKKEKKMKENY